MTSRASLLVPLLAGIPIALVLAFASPAAPAQLGSSGSFEPARARDLVTISTATVPYSNSFLPLPVGSEIVAYTVPSDRWLVLRDVDSVANNNPAVYLYEVLNGVATLKYARAPNPLQSSCGISFAPGSKVVWRNVHATLDLTLRYDMFGYLVER